MRIIKGFTKVECQCFPGVLSLFRTLENCINSCFRRSIYPISVRFFYKIGTTVSIHITIVWLYRFGYHNNHMLSMAIYCTVIRSALTCGKGVSECVWFGPLLTKCWAKVEDGNRTYNLRCHRRVCYHCAMTMSDARRDIKQVLQALYISNMLFVKWQHKRHLANNHCCKNNHRCHLWSYALCWESRRYRSL